MNVKQQMKQRKINFGSIVSFLKFIIVPNKYPHNCKNSHNSSKSQQQNLMFLRRTAENKKKPTS